MTLVDCNPSAPRRRTLFDVLAGDPFGDFSEAMPSADRWTPSVDIKENEEKFIVVADLPGIDPKDVEITMEKGALTIKGERESEHTEDKDGVHRVERACGSFLRRFSFPDSVDIDNISANGKNGVITIVVPKKPSVQPKRIAVR